MEFGEKITLLRRKFNLTKEEFSRKINVSKEEVENWENNIYIPDIEILKRISRTFNVSLDYLLLDGKFTTKNNNYNSIRRWGIAKKVALILFIANILYLSRIIFYNKLAEDIMTRYIGNLYIILLSLVITSYILQVLRVTKRWLYLTMIGWGINQFFIILLFYYPEYWREFLYIIISSSLYFAFLYFNKKEELYRHSDFTFKENFEIGLSYFSEKNYMEALKYFEHVNKSYDGKNAICCEYIIRCLSDDYRKIYQSNNNRIIKLAAYANETAELKRYITRVNSYENVKFFTLNIPDTLTVEAYSNLAIKYKTNRIKLNTSKNLYDLKVIIKEHYQEAFEYLSNNLNNVLELCKNENERQVVLQSVKGVLN